MVTHCQAFEVFFLCSFMFFPIACAVGTWSWLFRRAQKVGVPMSPMPGDSMRIQVCIVWRIACIYRIVEFLCLVRVCATAHKHCIFLEYLNQYTYNLLNATKYHKILRNVIMWHVVWYNMIWFYAIEVLPLTLWIYLYIQIYHIYIYIFIKTYEFSESYPFVVSICLWHEAARGSKQIAIVMTGKRRRCQANGCEKHGVFNMKLF